jgi:Cu+-exporting ATPase
MPVSNASPDVLRIIDLPVSGMDCTECTQHVQRALEACPGVESVEVFLTSQKAVLRLDPTRVSMGTLRKAVESAGYSVPETTGDPAVGHPSLTSFTRPVLTLFGLVVGAVLLIVVAGEWLGLFERVTDVVPWPVG